MFGAIPFLIYPEHLTFIFNEREYEFKTELFSGFFALKSYIEIKVPGLNVTLGTIKMEYNTPGDWEKMIQQPQGTNDYIVAHNQIVYINRLIALIEKLYKENPEYRVQYLLDALQKRFDRTITDDYPGDSSGEVKNRNTFYYVRPGNRVNLNTFKLEKYVAPQQEQDAQHEQHKEEGLAPMAFDTTPSPS